MCQIRNWVARSPLLRKGGAHTRNPSSVRFAGRAALEDGLDEWFDNDEEQLLRDARRQLRNKPVSGEPDAGGAVCEPLF